MPAFENMTTEEIAANTKIMNKHQIQSFLMGILEFVPAKDAYRVKDQARAWHWHFEIDDYATRVDDMLLLPVWVVERRMNGYDKQPENFQTEVYTGE